MSKPTYHDNALRSYDPEYVLRAAAIPGDHQTFAIEALKLELQRQKALAKVALNIAKDDTTPITPSTQPA